MVVVASRVETVRWKLAIEKFIKERGYKIGTLVALSGVVNDRESGPDGLTEDSPVLNPTLKGRDIRDAFKGAEYQNLPRREQVSDRLRSAAALRHVRGQSAGRDRGLPDVFRSDMGAFLRLYTFLSRIFDYGTTAIEKRAILYRRLLQLLEFGRERDEIDLSRVVLTHHKVKHLGKLPMILTDGEPPKLEPLTEAGSSMIRGS